MREPNHAVQSENAISLPMLLVATVAYLFITACFSVEYIVPVAEIWEFVNWGYLNWTKPCGTAIVCPRLLITAVKFVFIMAVLWLIEVDQTLWDCDCLPQAIGQC